MLQAHPQIVPHQVGLWAINQGGWIAPLAASCSPDVAFLIPVSGPGVSPAEQERYSLTQRSYAHGFAEHDIAQALALYDAFIQAARRDAPFDEVMTLITHKRTPAWDVYMGDLNAEVWQFLKRAIDDDPVPAFERVTGLVLAIFGERDMFVPVEQSARVLAQAFATAGNPDVTIRVFPHADHVIEVGTPATFAPDYLDTMVQWIWDRVPRLHGPR